MTTSLETFQIAIDEIKKLTEEKQELLEIISKQEKSIQLLNKKANNITDVIPSTKSENSSVYRLEAMIKESNEALKRYNENLKKELSKNAKQKQSKRKQA